MATPPAPSPAASSASSPSRAVLWGGAFAGTWDISFAFVYYGLRNGATMQGVLQSVAGGLIGRAASRAGGWPTAALGLVCHYVIALGAAAVYVALSRRLPALHRHAVASGLLFGALVYFVMNWLVLPLSAYHAKLFAPPDWWAVLAHMIGVGVPIALAARRFAR